MIVDNELQAWQRDWASTSITLDVPDLSNRVKRQTRLMKWMLASELLVTATIGGGTALAAIRRAEADMVVLAVATWLFLAVAWAFGIWTRRGAWTPASLTTAAYLQITIRRSRGAVRNATFGVVFFWVELLFCIGWIYARKGSFAFLFSPEMIGVGAASIAFMIFAVVYRKRKAAELAAFVQLEQSLYLETE